MQHEGTIWRGSLHGCGVFRRPDATKLLVLVSGRHGAEGYGRSAAQLPFLKANFQDALALHSSALHSCTKLLWICLGSSGDCRGMRPQTKLNRLFQAPSSESGIRGAARAHCPGRYLRRGDTARRGRDSGLSVFARGNKNSGGSELRAIH